MKKTINKNINRIASRILRSAVCMIMMLVLVLGTVSCGTKKDSPEKLLEKAIKQTAAQIETWGQGTSDTEKLLNGGSVELKATANLGLTLNAALKFYMNKDKGMLDLNVNEAIKASIYASEEDLIVKCDQILGKAYGVSIKNFKENLNKSVFAPSSQSKYAMSQADFDQILSIFDNQNINSKELSEKYQKLQKKYGEKLFVILKESVEITKEECETTVFDKTVASTALTFEISAKVMVEMIDKFWNEAKSDAELKAFVDEVLQIVKDMNDLGNIGNEGVVLPEVDAGAPEGGDVADAPKDLTDAENAEELFGMIDDEIAELKDRTAEDENAEKNKLVVKLYLNQNTNVIMRVDLKVEDHEGDEVDVNDASVELGETLDKFEGLRITFTAEASTGGTEDAIVNANDTANDQNNDTAAKEKITQVLYIKVVDSEEKYNISLEVTEGEETNKVLAVNYDKTAGKITLTAEGTEISATLTKGEGVYTFALDKKMKINGEETELPVDLTVTVKLEDPIPALEGGHTDLLTLNEAGVDELVNTVMTNLAPLLDMFGGNGGTDTENPDMGGLTGGFGVEESLPY